MARAASCLHLRPRMLTIAAFLLTSFIVVMIARAIVSGPDPGTAMTLVIGGATQMIASFATFMLGFGASAQPWSFVGAIALSAMVLSFYEDTSAPPRKPIEVPPCNPGVVPPPMPTMQPLLPAPRRSWGSRLGDASVLAAMGGFLMGITGFVIGFFGPMKYQPWANQGPMVGLFLTGPGGVLLGVIVGIVLGMIHPEWSKRRRIWTLNAANVAWGLFVLNLVMDRTKWH